MRQKNKELKWVEPLEMAEKIVQNYEGKNWIFLYSGLNSEVKNSKSIIALFSKNELDLNNLDELKKYLKTSQEGYDDAYFGYVSYEYKNDLEKFSETKKSIIELPKILLMNFALIFEFNHDEKILNAHFEDLEKLEEVLNYKLLGHKTLDIKTSLVQSNFSSQEYLNAIEKIKKMIENGDFYQTNLTRKFFGKINIGEKSQFFDIFLKLTKSSSANFSSFLKFGDNFIISASPELFLQVRNGEILSRPIKGTAPRSSDKKQDDENKKYLQESLKEQAENLMIVDLVRNDLSRISKAGSVKTRNLFKVNSYKTLHHLSSEIVGEIDDSYDAIDAFKIAFPAGSMTGAPKIKAIEVACDLEKINRGVYSGAIGYFKNLDEAIFSVVIRTLICRGNDFEFQVGGAITYDSKAQKELDETFTKAKAICEALNLEIDL